MRSDQIKLLGSCLRDALTKVMGCVIEREALVCTHFRDLTYVLLPLTKPQFRQVLCTEYILTFMRSSDVRGAFDAVLPGRLIGQLREQGWPTNMTLWVASFIKVRTASLRLGTHTSKTFNIPAGLPQGSPISTIHFMLFIEPIFKQGSKRTRRGRFGYADDICQLVASPSLEENYTALQHCTEKDLLLTSVNVNYNTSHVGHTLTLHAP